MIPFLQSVAEAYASRFKQDAHLAPLDYCFVFPNKRAGTFFLNYLRNLTPDDTISPAVTTISDLVTNLSGRLVAQRIDLLFLLYKCYTEASPQPSPQGREPGHEGPDSNSLPCGEGRGGASVESVISFDSFRRWGDTVLRDFNEVDMQNVDPDAIFKNVADFRRISSTFLTPEQRAVMEEYFGYSPSNYDDSKFWQDFDDDFSDNSDTSDNSDYSDNPESSAISKTNIRKKFILLWKIMGPLYHAFHKALAERGLTTSGGAYRLALQNLEAAYDAPDSREQIFSLLPYRKIVMVGFNALSSTERAIFSLLRRLPSPCLEEDHLTDFIWDATGPVLEDKTNSAGRFVAINRREYPSPKWTKPFLSQSDTKSLPPVIESIAAPSKVMQIKIATSLISDLLSEKGPEIFYDAKVALVVPDESLLLPLLYSLPKNIKEVNLTMGYPLRLTAVNSFLSLLRSIQLTPRNSSSYKGYAYEQVRDLLSHPYAHAIFSTQKIRRFCADKEYRHISVVRDSEFAALGKNGPRIFRQLAPDAAPDTVIAYIDDVLSIIEESLGDKEKNMIEGESILKGKLEKEHITAWRDNLRQLADSIREYGIRMNTAATLAEAYRLVRGESVAFEGKPLRGLQIMGMLETRALDFDYLYIVGLNDRTIPGRGSRRSFIPNVIRRGFGMPPNSYQEELFGYYFFRLLSRTKAARLIYDNRVSRRGGGESRYILQLRHIYARNLVKNIEYKFQLSSQPLVPIKIEKNEKVKAALERYCCEPPEGERRKNLSASLLKKYTSCPLKFYFSGVLDLGDDPAPDPAVNALNYGNIVHDVLQNLLLPDTSMHKIWLDPPVHISCDDLRDMIEDKEKRIPALTQKAINRHHYKRAADKLDTPLEPDTELIAYGVENDVKNVLMHDLQKSLDMAKSHPGNDGFDIYGVEIKSTYDYYLSDGRRINMAYAIDRVDSLECENPGEVRIIDYKTGLSHIEADSVEDLVSDNYKKDNLLQLTIYSMLVNLRRDEEHKPPLDILARIYPVSQLKPKTTEKSYLKKVIPTIGGNFIHLIGPTVTQFTPVFEDLLSEIFNPDIPFCSIPSEGKCAHCPFQDACRSVVS